MNQDPPQAITDGAYVERVSLTEIAEQFGTPIYVYSRAMLEARWKAFDEAFSGCKHRICYAVKACSNLAVLNILSSLGSGFDIVSGGELERVLRAGGRADRVVFSGVGKLAAEIERALKVGVGCLNIESAAELRAVEKAARATGRAAAVSLRVNPEVDAGTHDYITTGTAESKFGVSAEEATELYRYADRSEQLNPVGLSCHIGSQITRLEPFAVAAEFLTKLADEVTAQGCTIRHLDFGGGLGIGEASPAVSRYGGLLMEIVGNRPWDIWVEPGRAIVGEAGLLLTRVIYLKHGKHKHFAVVDAGMNDFLRPALYQAEHPVVAVDVDAAAKSLRAMHDWDVVGSICESGDFLARDCRLSLAEGDLVAVLAAGAYGFSMAGNYNSRPRPAEVVVDGAQIHLVRLRETFADLMSGERLVGEG